MAMTLDRAIFRSGRGLMVLETPLLKVSRPVAACSRCRAAKIKCDGKLPACSACEKTGKSAECASANDNFARGKERSYVSTLETKIERLERRLQEAQRRKSSTISMGDADGTQDSGGSQAARDLQAPSTSSGRAAKRKEARDIDELVSDFGYLTVNATARDYSGFASFMSYSRLVLSACAKDKLPTGMRVPLPPRNSTTAIVQYYLDHMYTLLPFFDETSLYYSIDAVYQALNDPLARSKDFDHFSLRMVLAITNVFQSKQRGDRHYLEGIGHVSAALEFAETLLKPGAMTSIQALLFLIEYALLDPHHFDAWSLVGAASRAMVDLGLHLDPSKGSRTSRSKLEIRRRVFYCVYMLDRPSAIVQTRSYSFSDDSFSVANPFQPDQAPQTSPTASQWLKPLDNAHNLLALRGMQSRWYYDLHQSGRDAWSEPYSYLWRTYHAMATWFAGLSPKTPDTVRSMFELELYYSYIYILGPSARVPRPHPYAQTLLFEHCITYAQLLTNMMTDTSRPPPVTFDDNMKAYMTGMQLLDVLVKSRDQLISGVAPEPPALPSGSMPAPSLPASVQNDPNTNLIRAMTAIKQISEVLKQFGRRWGFNNWRDDFEAAVEPMLVALNSRLWELSQTALDRGRRPGAYPPSSSSGSTVTGPTSVLESIDPNAAVRYSSVSPPRHPGSYTPAAVGAALGTQRYPSSSPPRQSGVYNESLNMMQQHQQSHSLDPSRSSSYASVGSSYANSSPPYVPAHIAPAPQNMIPRSSPTITQQSYVPSNHNKSNTRQHPSGAGYGR